MPKFVLGFNVFDCRSLELQEGMVNADIFMTAEAPGGNFWESEVQEESSPNFLVWNKKIIWSNIELLEEEFTNAYIEFNVYSRNWFSRNYLIGKATLQLKSINERQNQVYAKKSVPLIKEGVKEPCGVMTLTTYCLREGQSPPNEQYVDEGEGENNPENDDLASAVCGSVINMGDGRPHMVYLDIYKVINLPMTSWGPLGVDYPSPFVTVEFCGNRVVVEGTGKGERCNFNSQVIIPVMTPVYEDTILVKLWDDKTLQADALLAQGMISFSELRNKPLPPRWFSLYGYDSNEITDQQVAEIAKEGENIMPNCFKGRLLMSGRVECFDTIDELKPAGQMPTRTSAEPAQVQRTLLADVYEVCGVVGREAQVELSVANQAQKSKWQTAVWSEPESDDENEEDDPNEVSDEATSFKFKQDFGRIEALSLMMPEERDSRPLVMINIYVRGVLSAMERIGWTTVQLHEIKRYEPGNPSRPKFLAFNPMPFGAGQLVPASILMTLEQHTSENVQRHNRKYMKPLKYVIRAYMFMARFIKVEHPQKLGMRVACAGVSKCTTFRSEVRPMWMEPMDLKIVLNSNHKDEPPTMEPITVTLCIDKGPIGYLDVGKSIVSYEYMRQKDSMSAWEPFKLDPQWIELCGGSYGTLVVAEVLVAFELLQRSALKELKPLLMWPAEAEDYDETKHFCKLRKATLHFSLLGLRDLVQGETLGANIGKKMGEAFPEVEVQVKKFSQVAADPKSKVPKYYQMKFRYEELIEGGDKKNKDDILKNWKTNALGRTDNTNYEFFKAQQVNIKLPDLMILEPFITIKVTSKHYLNGAPGVGYEVPGSTEFVGDHRRCLNSLFPCSWYEGIDPMADYDKQVDKIKIEQDKGKKTALPRRNFEEETAGDRKMRLFTERQDKYNEALENPMAGVKKEPEVQKDTGPDGLPPAFHEWDAVTNPIGLRKGEKEKLKMCTKFNPQGWLNMNFDMGTMFSPRKGETTKGKAEDVTTIFGNYENTHVNPKCDFYFAGQPLLKNHDIVDPEDFKTNWHFEHRQCFGFVKCVFKLTDGWEGEEKVDEGGDDDPASGGIGALLGGGAAHALTDGAAAEKPKWLQGVNDALQKVGLKGLAGAVAEDVAEDVAGAVAKADKPKEFDPEELDPPDWVTLPFSGEKIELYTTSDIHVLKLEFLRHHAQNLWQKVTANPKVKMNSPASKSESELRAWVIRVQQRMLEPLRESPVQKELIKMRDVVREKLEGVKSNAKLNHVKELLEPLQAVQKRMLKVEGEDDDTPLDERMSVTYADFMRTKIRLVIRECAETLLGKELDVVIKQIRERMINLERLAASFKFDRDVNRWAFISKDFYDHYRLHTPTRIKCRLYFVRGVIIFGKAYASADPYISFTIGQEVNSLRTSPCWGTNEPAFYRTEERDLTLPEKGRLQVDLFDIKDLPGPIGTDPHIGTTIIDMEDRWHSPHLYNLMSGNGNVPKEERPIYMVLPNGKQSVSGSLLMWVELIDSVLAADKKVTPLQKPPPTEIELRFVIYTCENCKLVDGGKIDARVYINLKCEEYLGPFPHVQKTDTHHGSLGSAIFNWRMVYPKILMPTQSCIVDIDLYDYNLIAGDSAVGSISMDIKKYVEKVASSMDTITKSSTIRFTSPLDEDEGQNIGDVTFEMWVMPQSEAARKPAGIERTEPNENPELMTPMEGRGWDSILPSLAFSFGLPSFYKKMIPLIVFTLLCLVGMKQTGML